MKNRKHIISIDQFDRPGIEALLVSAWNLEQKEWKLFPPSPDDFFIEQADIMFNEVMATVFFEPSTRTRLSFEAAFLKMGGKVISVEDAFDNSSSRKGENFLDTIKTISQIAGVIVCRHPELDSVLKMAEISDCPVINAGDGTGEHPSQAFIDLYTIWKEKKTLNDLKIAIIGDLQHARTINSFRKIMSFYDSTIIEHELEVNDPVNLSDIDVLYVTRVQEERRNVFKEVGPIDISSLKEDAIILHPLPRGKELPVEIDEDPRAAYWKQVKNSVPVRQALFLYAYGIT